MNVDSLQPLMKYIPLLIPILLIQLALVVFAIIDLVKTTKTRGPKWMWALIILFVNFIGPILYFTVGRERE